MSDLLPEPMMLVSLPGNIEAANAAFHNLCRWRREEVVGQPLSQVTESAPSDYADYLRHCAGTRQMLPGAISFRCADGTAIRCRCEGAVFRPASEAQTALVLLRVIPRDHASTRFIGLTHKNTELGIEIGRRRAAEQAAAHANRLKDEFLATLSHELRTPLNAIVGWTQLAMRGHFNAERMQQALETIHRNAQAQSRMVDDLLEVSGAARGKLRLDMQVVDLRNVIAMAVEALAVTAAGKGVAINVAVTEPVANVTGDPQRLQQVVWNLLSNALKFTHASGHIEISLRQQEADVHLGVSDNGEGISADFLPDAFLRFRQGDPSTTRKHGGLGIGLALVKELVELHGGRVRIESGGPGQGTTVTIELPGLAQSETRLLPSAS
jgi:signal transduction histidine kinase